MYGWITLVFLSYQCAGPRPTSAGPSPCVCQSRRGFIWDPHTAKSTETRDQGGPISANCLLQNSSPLPGLASVEGGGEASRAPLREDTEARATPPPATHPAAQASNASFPHLNGNSEPPGGAFLLAQPVNPCGEEGGAIPRQQRPAPGTGPAMLLSRT